MNTLIIPYNVNIGTTKFSMFVGSNFMRIITIILLFFNLTCFSQTKLDFGEIRGKNISDCIDTIDGEICQSKNQLEIWFTETTFLEGNYNAIYLSYNGVRWTALKHEGDSTSNRVEKYRLFPIESFESIFSALKKNKIFILPDQKELKVKNPGDDGDEYVLTFKAGEKIRTYQFNNPRLNLKYNKDIPEFENFVNIIEILFNSFRKEIN